MKTSALRAWQQWLGALVFLVSSCQLASAGDNTLLSYARPFLWLRQSLDLPPSIRVYEGFGAAQNGAPLRAWYAEIDTSDKNLQVAPFLSSNAIGREPAQNIARQNGALIAVNGGYFDMRGVPAKTFSLVMRDNRVLVPNVAQVSRSNGKYSVTRAAFGIRANGTFDVAWIAHIVDEKGVIKLYAYDEPTPNTLTQIAAPPSTIFPRGARFWDAQNAVGGGPVLISNGQIIDTYQAEAFFNSGFLSGEAYPRTAVGYTKTNRLILFAVDGKRVDWSEGLTLRQVAQEMQKLGCVEAMNLDGGGSTTFVARDRVLNRPSDDRERNVSSILAIVPKVAPIVAVQINEPSKATTPKS